MLELHLQLYLEEELLQLVLAVVAAKVPVPLISKASLFHQDSICEHMENLEVVAALIFEGSYPVFPARS